MPMIYMIYRTGESSFAREIIGVAAVPALLLPSFKRRQEQEDRVRVIELSKDLDRKRLACIETRNACPMHVPVQND